MRIAYFDCFSGISGARVLGALLDIGIDFDSLRNELAKLPLTDYEMTAKPVTRGGISATKVSIKAMEKGLVRTYANIRQVIGASKLKPSVKERSLMIFQLLAQAQAKINRKSIESIHFHEVGAIDSVVDIVGSAIGINMLKVDQVYFSPLPMGLGMTRTEHGMMPLPSPVTLEILSGVPIYSCDIQAELVTPTGASIARSFAQEFSDMPQMTLDHTGYGAGAQELDIPNLLRLVIGDAHGAKSVSPVVRIEAILESKDKAKEEEIVAALAEEDVVDVWLSSIVGGGKNNRSLLNVVGPLDKEVHLINKIFDHTQVGEVRVGRQSSYRRK